MGRDLTLGNIRRLGSPHHRNPLPNGGALSLPSYTKVTCSDYIKSYLYYYAGCIGSNFSPNSTLDKVTSLSRSRLRNFLNKQRTLNKDVAFYTLTKRVDSCKMSLLLFAF